MSTLYQPSGDPAYRLWGDRPIRSMHAELTDKCNAGCAMCPRYVDFGAKVNPNLPLTEVTVEDFRRWFPPSFVGQMIKFYACGNYGDPIVARDCLDIYQYLRSANDAIILGMHTNGSARTPDWWAALGATMNKEGRDFCTFSIDGLADTNHLYRRRTDFDRIMANVQAFIGAGGIAHWDFIVFDYNEHQVEEARDLARRMGFENFNIKRTTRWFKYEDGRGAYPVKNRKGEIEYWLRQPEQENWRDTTLKALRESLNKPTFITAQEFELLDEGLKAHAITRPDGSTEMIHHNQIDIACRAVKGPMNTVDEVFLSATGHLFPCCFLGGEPWRMLWNDPGDNILRMIELNGGMDSISLHHHSMAEIIESPLYAEMIARTFAKGHGMRSRQCSTCCGKEWNKLDHGELGAKNKAYFDERKNARSPRA